MLDVKMPVLDGISAAGADRHGAHRAGRHAHGPSFQRELVEARATPGRWPTPVKPFTQGASGAGDRAGGELLAEITTLESEVADLPSGSRPVNVERAKALLQQQYGSQRARRSVGCRSRRWTGWSSMREVADVVIREVTGGSDDAGAVDRA